ncbi:MAG: EndoU domain-containing protein [Myxococcaceae bacterium]
MTTRRLALLALCLLGTLARADSASYIAPVSTQAVEQPGSHHVSFEVQAGTAYPLLKRGGPGGAWCKLASPSGGAPGWVPCERSPGPEGAHPAPAAGTAGHCLSQCTSPPLFSSPVALSAVDREVLSVCPARPDAAASLEDVRRFMSAHVDDERLVRALSAAGRPGDRGANVEWLASLWVGTGPRNAFTHVFCGDDWTKAAIGGLHYLPRYAQLESEGKLCFGGPVKGKEVLQGGQYTFRFSAVTPWSCGVKRVGGFTVQHDAVQVVAIGTRAFARCCNRSGGSKDGGVYAAPDLGGVSYRIWCGTRNGSYGIATLYPTDEAPTCGP